MPAVLNTDSPRRQSTFLRATTAVEDEELTTLVDQLPPEVLAELQGLLVGLLCTIASSLAWSKKNAPDVDHRYLVTGASSGFSPSMLEAVLFRLAPDLRVAAMARKCRLQLDAAGLEAQLAAAGVFLAREGDSIWVLPRTKMPAPLRELTPLVVRARVVKPTLRGEVFELPASGFR